MKKSEGFIKDLLSGRFGAVIRRRINLEKEIKRHRKAYWTRIAKRDISKLPSNELTTKEQQALQDFWEKKYGYKLDPIFHKFYKTASGKFDKMFIPEGIHFTFIDPYFNDWTLGKPYDNKTNYRVFFSKFRQPEVIGYRINGYWMDRDMGYTNLLNVVNQIRTKKKKCFIKVATDSSGGHGVYFVDGEKTNTDEILNIISKIDQDIVIQEELLQSQSTSILNSSSLNTIRVMTFLRKDGSVKICSIIIRIGGNGSKVDNASSGGITVGINMHGKLNEFGYTLDGIRFKEHPTTHVKFQDITLPIFEKIIDMAKQGALSMPTFRLISWDIALDKDNQATLIEANLYAGGIKSHQLNNGPLFGEDTEEILNEIKEHPKRIYYTI